MHSVFKIFLNLFRVTYLAVAAECDDHLQSPMLEHITNFMISTATRTNFARLFPIIISTATGTAWWYDAVEWSSERQIKGTLARARYDAVSALYEKRCPQVINREHRQLRLWLSKAASDPWALPGSEHQHLRFLRFFAFWRIKSGAVKQPFEFIKLCWHIYITSYSIGKAIILASFLG